MNQKLRVGVVGCGVGKAHMKAYRELPDAYDLAAVCDLDEGRLEECGRNFDIPVRTTSFSELCLRDDLDVIDLCTPPWFHFGQILEALGAGKHVVCEKPLVSSLQEIDELAIAQQESGLWIMPIFQVRFGQGLQKLKLLTEQGVAGRCFMSTVEVAWRRRSAYYSPPWDWRGRWETELGGILTTHAIHAHDVLCYVHGRVRRVFARAATMVNRIEVEDCAVVCMEMENGSFASSSCTLGSAEEISRHRFCFEHLTAESPTILHNSKEPWKFVGDSEEIDAQIKDTLAAFQPLPEGYAGQFCRFAEALRASIPPPVALADARRSLELLSAMYHSARTGAQVELPLSPDHPVYKGWLPVEKTRSNAGKIVHELQKE